MSALQQLAYVEKHFQKNANGKPLKSLGDVYMAVLWPKAVGAPETHVLFADGTNVYTMNKGLDANKDGQIKKAEATKRVHDKLVLGVKEGRIG